MIHTPKSSKQGTALVHPEGPSRPAVICTVTRGIPLWRCSAAIRSPTPRISIASQGVSAPVHNCDADTSSVTATLFTSFSSISPYFPINNKPKPNHQILTPKCLVSFPSDPSSAPSAQLSHSPAPTPQASSKTHLPLPVSRPINKRNSSASSAPPPPLSTPTPPSPHQPRAIRSPPPDTSPPLCQSPILRRKHKNRLICTEPPHQWIS